MEKLKKMLLSNDAETRRLGRRIYEEDPIEELKAYYDQSKLLGKGLWTQIEKSHIHIYDPSKLILFKLNLD